MKKILWLMTMVLGFCTGLFAQNQMQDVVPLKEDSVHRTNAEQQTAKNYNVKGFRVFTDLGYTFGSKKVIGGGGRVELSPSIGYQIHPYLYMGAGLGLHYYIDAVNFYSSASPLVLSPFADIRSNFTDDAVTPFLGIKAGYTFSIKGLYIASSLGLKFKTGAHTAMSLSLGYTYQSAETVDIYISDSKKNNKAEINDRNIGGISVRIGFEGW
jgi:hypothetical protein